MSQNLGTRVGTLILTVIVVFAGGQVRPEQLDKGGEWLAWSSAERATFVQGFIAGYRRGSHGACDVAQELFGSPGKMYRLGDEKHPSEMPSARCLAQMGEYSRSKYTEASGLDVAAYTNVITEFYIKHPEYRDVAFVNLLGLLSDREYKTADQIYQMAREGKITPLR